ncbi:glycoside hydrolase family 108 protein [Methylobacterium oryzihabitans]|uniref:Uncharacterized protein n=1 Tax=Methylobacterium oryzihabitans TaxID=2499852 RepID=A0A437NT38_9HYPH|nr:glycoside hydrolase family 108 protein [Methylobacterium oryzihabitans]RVU13206.1 hypothetical protein EOE48_26890 [Methylobacterium oryzihabitans]
MDATYDQAFGLVLKHEGGYVDHPDDPGGATNLGVTIGTLSAWLGRAATKAEVRALTVAAVAPIYRARYWNAVRGDDLPAGLDYAVFDFAVNSGPGRAVMALQRALGVADDGRLGPVTLTALADKDPVALITALCDDRMAFLRKLSTWGSFGKGWTSRVQGVRAGALAMARKPPAAPTSAKCTSCGKALAA